MTIISVEKTRLKTLCATFSGYYFKKWNIEQTKTGYIIYNDMTGDSATISNKFLHEFYNDDFLAFVRSSLKELPKFKQTMDIELIEKIQRFSDGYVRFKRELKKAFELFNYSYVCLFEQELPISINWSK